jgi:hypothetical protein
MARQGAYWRLYEAQAKNAEAVQVKLDSSRDEEMA